MRRLLTLLFFCGKKVRSLWLAREVAVVMPVEVKEPHDDKGCKDHQLRERPDKNQRGNNHSDETGSARISQQQSEGFSSVQRQDGQQVKDAPKHTDAGKKGESLPEPERGIEGGSAPEE